MNFKKHYTVMNGIASSGTGVGMVLWPVIFQAVINHYTWRGALLLMGGIQLNLLSLALLLRLWTSPGKSICSGNARKGPREDVGGKSNGVINTISCSDLSNMRANDSEVTNGASVTETDMAKESTTTAVPRGNNAEGNDDVINTISGKLPYGTESDSRPSEVVVTNSPKFDLYVVESEINYGESASAIGQDDGVCDEEHPSTWCRPIPNTISTAELIGIDSEQPSHNDSACSAPAKGFFKTMSKSTGLSLLWENKVFACFLPVFIFGGGPLGTFLAHAASAARSNGTPSIQAAFLISVVGIASVITRATHGLLLKTGLIHQVLLFASAYVIAGLSVYVFPVTPHYAVMVVCAIGVGVGSGIFIPLQLVLMRHIVPVQRFPGAIGMMLLCVCVGVMTSSLVSGFLLDQTGSYPLAFTFAGSMSVAAGLIVIIEHIVWSYCLRDERWPPKVDHRSEEKDR